LTGFNEKILWMYAHGFSTRDIQAQLLEWYGVEVSPTLISNVTEAVMDEVRQWQNRPLETLYPIMYVDWMAHQSARKPAYPRTAAVYLALGITDDRTKRTTGHVDRRQMKGPAFWLAVCTELRNRGSDPIALLPAWMASPDCRRPLRRSDGAHAGPTVYGSSRA
jgi:transposase-like protein